MALTKIQTELLGAGSVLQVVNATYSTVVVNSSTTFIDTGLTATITPKYSTSKILIIVDLEGCFVGTTTTSLVSKLLRNSTSILSIDAIAGYSGGISGVGGTGATYLDSPATTSATIYKIQIATGTNGYNAYINATSGGTSTSTITLMEIAG